MKVRYPPAEPPQTATRLRSMPNSLLDFWSHFQASSTSSMIWGSLASGARR